MKKIVLCFILLLVGCSSNKENENTMEQYSKTYYNNHMIMTNSTSVSITKEMLMEAKDEDGYDMSKLQNCTSDSKVVFTIDNKQIVKTEYFLDCK